MLNVSCRCRAWMVQAAAAARRGRCLLSSVARQLRYGEHLGELVNGDRNRFDWTHSSKDTKKDVNPIVSSNLV